MTNPAAAALSRLRRPRLLIRAARFGLADYDRRRVLRRILPDSAHAADPLVPLMDREADCEAARKNGEASYDISRHVEILIALMCEANAVPTPGSSL